METKRLSASLEGLNSSLALGWRVVTIHVPATVVACAGLEGLTKENICMKFVKGAFKAGVIAVGGSTR